MTPFWHICDVKYDPFDLLGVFFHHNRTHENSAFEFVQSRSISQLENNNSASWISKYMGILCSRCDSSEMGKYHSGFLPTMKQGWHFSIKERKGGGKNKGGCCKCMIYEKFLAIYWFASRKGVQSIYMLRKPFLHPLVFLSKNLHRFFLLEFHPSRLFTYMFDPFWNHLTKIMLILKHTSFTSIIWFYVCSLLCYSNCIWPLQALFGVFCAFMFIHLVDTFLDILLWRFSKS